MTFASTIGGSSAPLPSSIPSPGHKQQQKVPTKTLTTRTVVSLDSLADDFLSMKPSPILLKPNPLPRGQTEISRLKTLVDRRAWSDVLKYCSTLLMTNKDSNSTTNASTKSKSRQYSKVYNSLLVITEDEINEYNTDDDNEITHSIRQETLEIMILRCNAMLKLRRYADLSKEVNQWNFLNAQSPHWIPFSLDILACQSYEYNPEKKEKTTDILCQLRERIPSTEYGWLASVDNALTNIFIRRGNYRLAIGSLDRVFDLIPEATKTEVESAFAKSNDPTDPENVRMIIDILTKIRMCEICSRQGRIMLQAGAVIEAGVVFEDAKIIWSEVESIVPSLFLPQELCHHNESIRMIIPSLLKVNEGLLNFANSNYSHALQSFSQAIIILQKSGDNLHSKYCTQDWIGPSIVGTQSPRKIYNETINNITLCHLYMCNMKEAVVQLESLVRQDPTAFLTERVAFNLSTLYELGSESGAANRKKRVLQLIAKRFFLHDIGPESFRIA